MRIKQVLVKNKVLPTLLEMKEDLESQGRDSRLRLGICKNLQSLIKDIC